MFIEYCLQSEMGDFQGVFDTEGFWVQRKEEIDGEGTIYKIWGAFNFAFATRDSMLYSAVFDALRAVLVGLSAVVYIHDKQGKNVCRFFALTPEQLRPMLFWLEDEEYFGWTEKKYPHYSALVYKFPEIGRCE